MQHLKELLAGVMRVDGQPPVKVVATVVVVIGCFICHRLLMLAVTRHTEDPAVRYHWRKGSGYSWFGLAVLLVGFLWFQAFETLGTFLGLLSAGVTIALRDIVANIAGWFYLVARRPFEVGDRIQLGDNIGDVIDINVFHFTLLEVGNWVDAEQSTGRIIHIPNNRLMTQALANYSKGFHFIWNEVPVLVTFESDWKRAKNILRSIADRVAVMASQEAEKHVRQAARRFLVYYPNLTPIVYTSVKDSGVLLTIRYLCEPRNRRGSQAEIWEAVLDAFAGEPNIEFAYPTQRFFRVPGDSDDPFAPPDRPPMGTGPLAARGHSR